MTRHKAGSTLSDTQLSGSSHVERILSKTSSATAKGDEPLAAREDDTAALPLVSRRTIGPDWESDGAGVTRCVILTATVVVDGVVGGALS